MKKYDLYDLFGLIRIKSVALVVLMFLIVGCTANKEINREKSISTSADSNIIPSQSSEEPQSSMPIPLSHLATDLNGDKINDSAFLTYTERAFVLTVDDTKAIIPSDNNGADFNDTDLAPPYVTTAITALRVNRPVKPLLINVEWGTNGIGSTEEIWLYDYMKGNLSLRWNLKDELPTIRTTKVDSHTISITIPDYKLKQEFRLTNEDTDWIGHSILTNDPLTYPELIWIGTPISYKVIDLDGDGCDEVVVNRIVDLVVPPYRFGDLYTIFRIKDGKLVPSGAFISRWVESQIADLILFQNVELSTDRKNLLKVLENRTSIPAKHAAETVHDMEKKGILQKRNNHYQIKISP